MCWGGVSYISQCRLWFKVHLPFCPDVSGQAHDHDTNSIS